MSVKEANHGCLLMLCWWKRHSGLILTGLFGFGLVVAVWGFMDLGQGFLNSVYLTLQLIVLNVDLSHQTINTEIQLARFTLPGIAAYATISSFFTLAGHHAHFFRLKWQPPQSVFLGAGRIAVGLMDQLQTIQPMVALDLDTDQPYARALSAKRVRLVAGDATNSETLRKLNIAESKFVYVLTGDDRRNLDIAREIAPILEGLETKPRLIVAITDNTLLRLACRDPEFISYRFHEGSITWLNAPAQAARALLRDFPPDRDVEPTSCSTPIHIAIAGFGTHGQAIALQVARNCIYADERRIRISVFDSNERAYEDFLLHHPVFSPDGCDIAHNNFTPVADMVFEPYSSGAAAPASIRNAQSASAFSIVYVAMEDDYSGLLTAMRFAQANRAMGRNCRVVCVLPGTRFGSEAEAKRLTEGYPDLYQGVEIFHAISRCIRPNEKYPGADSDSLGIAIDATYHTGEGEAPDKLSSEIISLQKKNWEVNLDDGFRWSSRYCADHIPVKLRALGLDLIQDGSVLVMEKTANDELLSMITANQEMLERMEHRRYCVERLLDGWLYADTESDGAERKNKSMQLNKTIIPFDKLSDIDRHKDSRIILNIPDILATTDLVLIRKGQTKLTTQSAE